MTLCEVATAKHHSLPLECQPFSLDGRQERGSITPQIQGECVDALARSAQFWSSYSGYLRELPQLCHAFRRWNDIDLAKEIYQNATLEKIALIRYIKSRETTSSEYLQEWTKQMKKMQLLVQETKHTAEKYKSTTDHVVMEINENVNGTLIMLRNEWIDFMSRRRVVEESSIAHLHSNVDLILQQHGTGLSDILVSMNQALNHHIEAILAHSARNYQQLDILATGVQSRWMQLAAGFDTMQEAVSLGSDNAGQILEKLSAVVDQANSITDIQSGASASAASLAATLAQFTETVQSELEKINGSASIIHGYLSLQERGSNLPWKEWMMNVLGYIYKADPASFAYLDQLLSFRVFLSVFSVSRVLFRALFSAITSIFLVCFLVSRKIFMKQSARAIQSALHQCVVLEILTIDSLTDSARWSKVSIVRRFWTVRLNSGKVLFP
ncbi:hypothetical protein B0H34DRAFT_710251 [Crassisporium funariophilum]|nr:hypothetical protein B0H34DRAFT_710251 [Crassisporium funariophilum]